MGRLAENERKIKNFSGKREENRQSLNLSGCGRGKGGVFRHIIGGKSVGGLEKIAANGLRGDIEDGEGINNGVH